MIRVLLIAAAGLALSACNQKKEERAGAAGEVLEGTVSDAMIATDQIRSEAPLAPRASSSSGDKGKKAGGAKASPAAASDEPPGAEVTSPPGATAAPSSSESPPSE